MTRSPTCTGALTATTKCAPGLASRVLTSLITISLTGVPAATSKGGGVTGLGNSAATGTSAGPTASANAIATIGAAMICPP